MLRKTPDEPSQGNYFDVDYNMGDMRQPLGNGDRGSEFFTSITHVHVQLLNLYLLITIYAIKRIMTF